MSAFQDDDDLRVIKVMESGEIERSQSRERFQRRGADILSSDPTKTLADLQCKDLPMSAFAYGHFLDTQPN